MLTDYWQAANNLPAAEAAVITEPATLHDFISEPATESGMVCPSPSVPAAVMVVSEPVIAKGEYNYLMVLIVSLDLLR